MKNCIMILADYTPRLMEMKSRIEGILSRYEEIIQFRLFRNLTKTSKFSEDAASQYLYIIFGDIPKDADLCKQLFYIKVHYPYAKILGVYKKGEQIQEGLYKVSKKGYCFGNMQVIQEDKLELYFEEQMRNLSQFKDEIHLMKWMEKKRRKTLMHT